MQGVRGSGARQGGGAGCGRYRTGVNRARRPRRHRASALARRLGGDAAERVAGLGHRFADGGTGFSQGARPAAEGPAGTAGIGEDQQAEGFHLQIERQAAMAHAAEDNAGSYGVGDVAQNDRVFACARHSRFETLAGRAVALRGTVDRAEVRKRSG